MKAEIRYGNNHQYRVYEDGEIFENGKKIGKLHEDGDIYIEGKKIGREKPDGEIWIEGEKRGKIHKDGDIWMDGKKVGYSKPPIGFGVPGGDFDGLGVALGFGGVILGGAFCYASFRMWTGGMFEMMTDSISTKGIPALLALLLLYGLLILCGDFQIYMTLKEGMPFGDSMGMGVVLQGIAWVASLVMADFMMSGGPGETNIFLLIIAALGTGIFPGFVGAVIAAILKKFRKNREQKEMKYFNRIRTVMYIALCGLLGGCLGWIIGQ
ncbi:MAG: hypothetical protein EOM34_08785 [Clostridia bacterium]|jgi:hypothetical protein|nr:hypothetical protein [Lachnospiraceae bacterium]NCC00761.1 hypothetical protein [Clostridia bacterium]NCD03125.1 hypothetical protein [Clostridia bacterium]